MQTKLLDSCAFFLLNTQQRPQRKHRNLPEFSEVTNNMQTAEFMLFEQLPKTRHQKNMFEFYYIQLLKCGKHNKICDCVICDLFFPY